MSELGVIITTGIVGVIVGAVTTYAILTNRYSESLETSNIIWHEHLRREHPGRGIPFIDLPLQNLVHLLTAEHEPNACPNGTCRRLDVDRAIKDLQNVARSRLFR